MLSANLPPVHFLSKTNLQPEFHHSILISFIRGLAAIEVVAAHLRAQLYPSLKSLPDPTIWYQALAFFTGFAHQAVVLFFLLSGWLVGGSLLNKLREPGIMAAYTIDRVTRLWIVLIPAFVLSLLFAIVTEAVDPREVSLSLENPYSISAFAGNLLGLQDMVVPRFGGNFALWSLANETWYYVLFPLLLLAFIGRTVRARAAAALIAALIAYHLSYAIVLYFAIWLLGVAFSRVKIDATRTWRVLMFLLFAGIAVYFRLTGSNDKLEPHSFVQDVVFSIAFLVLLCSLQVPANPANRALRIASVAGQHLAAFSFTLYVIHVPVLSLMRHMYLDGSGKRLAPDDTGDFMIYAVMLLLIVLFAYLFHLPFEAQTHRIRRMIKFRLAAGRRSPPHPNAVSGP